jgi:hypothetical protein
MSSLVPTFTLCPRQRAKYASMSAGRIMRLRPSGVDGTRPVRVSRRTVRSGIRYALAASACVSWPCSDGGVVWGRSVAG